MKKSPHGFTLIEILVTLAIIAILAICVLKIAPVMIERGKQTQSLNNLRQIGVGFLLYAGDNDGTLPQRTTTSDKWPKLLNSYLENPKVFSDPGDPKNYFLTKSDPLDNSANHTSYIMNGYNDLGAYSNPSVAVKLVSIPKQSQIILAALQYGTSNFYMDFQEGNQSSVLNRTAYHEGSNYLFTDGSTRFIRLADYNDKLWLLNPDYVIPPL